MAMRRRPRAVDWSRGLARRLGLVRVMSPLMARFVLRRDPLEVWKSGLASEIRFWERVLPRRVARDPDYRWRSDPHAPVKDPLLVLLLARIPEETVSLIDVGAGPLTALGKTYPGKTLRITATDPLAGEFLRIMREAGISPPVPPIACRGEDLLERFDPETFDIAFARNALDHSIDPIRVMTNMVRLVKDGRFVVLRHFRRVADLNAYRGLHQWNFDVENGQFVLWRARNRKTNVEQALGGAATLECFEEDPWVVCVMKKKRSV